MFLTSSMEKGNLINALREASKKNCIFWDNVSMTEVWYQNLVLELFSRIKSSSLEIFQLEKLQNIEGMILERNGVDFRNEDDQIS